MRTMPSVQMPVMEDLEPRLLLAADFFSDNFAAAVEEPDFSDKMPAEGGQVLMDEGDYYWAEGRRIPLLRVADEAVVRTVTPGVFESALSSLLQSATQISTMLQWTTFDDSTFALSGLASIGQQPGCTLDALRQDPAIKWVGPVFFSPETGSRLWPTDRVVVALRPGFDPVTLFGAFTEYEHVFRNEYVLTVEDGPKAALRVANDLALDPAVSWATAVFYHDFSLSTNDPLYQEQWHLNNTGQFGALPDADADVPEAWATTPGIQGTQEFRGHNTDIP